MRGKSWFFLPTRINQARRTVYFHALIVTVSTNSLQDILVHRLKRLGFPVQVICKEMTFPVLTGRGELSWPGGLPLLFPFPEIPWQIAHGLLLLRVVDPVAAFRAGRKRNTLLLPLRAFDIEPGIFLHHVPATSIHFQ